MAVYWALLLHFYQPPTQLRRVLRQVVQESYRPLVQLFADNPHARATVNISAVLTEMLWEEGHQDIVEGLAWLADRGQVEFTGSAKYHPILPLLPEVEIRRQIRANHATNRRHLGPAYAPRGFFPPEMCYSESIVAPVLDSGHDWMVLSGIACPGPWPLDVVQEDRRWGDPLAFVFRDDILSNEVAFHAIDGRRFLARLRDLRHQHLSDVYVVTAMDAETFGHHIPDWTEAFLGEVYARLLRPSRQAALEAIYVCDSPAAGRAGFTLATVPAAYQALRVGAPARSELSRWGGREIGQGDVCPVTISELVDAFPRRDGCCPRPSSWSTTAEDLDRGVPYPLWDDPANPIHRLLWEHTSICFELVRLAEHETQGSADGWHAGIARAVLDGALHSCQFWWASQRPHWDVNMVFRGLAEQEQAMVNAARAIEHSGAGRERKRLAWRLRIAALEVHRQLLDHLVMR